MFYEKRKAFNFITKQTLAQVFSVNFEKFPRTAFSQNTSGQLLLHVADKKAAVDKTVFEKESSI